MSITDITSPHWRGERAAPIDPATIRFTAAPPIAQGKCTGCLFVAQLARVCTAVNNIAERASMPSCSNWPEYIYVTDPSPQMWLVEVAA